ncbi:MAG: BatA domain-containing protein [Phycisphaerae bacterium]|nr:BatA domain-containing protein [Phycisphaerae bacterium]
MLAVLSLGPITFAAPAMLWGALAATGPIVVHLMLRAKARPTPLPTVCFVMKMQRQTQSRQRLKHLLLLLLRMLGILLLVAALARPTLETAAFSTPAREPVEAVFCIDDSASMGYRSRNQTRFEAARDLAVRLLRDRDRFPSGSRLALLTGSRPRSATRLSLDVNSLRQEAEQLQLAEHDQGLAAMLSHAYALLAEGVLPAREIYLFSDMNKQAWRDVAVEAHRSREEVRVYCIDVGLDSDTNCSLLDLVVPDRSVSQDVPVKIRFGLRAGQIAAERSIDVVLDGRPRWRSGSVRLDAGQTRQQVVELGRLEVGLHQGEARIRPDDPLAIDDVRYFTVVVGPLPEVVVVGPTDSQTAELVSAMISPVGVAPERRLFSLRRASADELKAGEGLRGARAIILADVASIPKATFEALRAYVMAGGCLILVPGPSVEVGGYGEGGGVLPAIPADVVSPPSPVGVAPSESVHPFLRAFQDGSGLSLSTAKVFRYLRFDRLAADARVIAHLDDGGAAIVIRPIGKGTSVALAFSPVRQWSEFAIDAGPMLVLLSTIIEQASSSDAPSRNLRVGQRVSMGVPGGGAAGSGEGRTVVITSPTLRATFPRIADPNSGTVEAVTRQCGQYLVGSGGAAEKPQSGYSVNTPAGESDLSRSSFSAISARFPPGMSGRVTEVEALDASRGSRPRAHALTAWLAIVLLGVLLGESFLSNRFHRRPEAEVGPMSGSAEGDRSDSQTSDMRAQT